jgi:hypothetical protein
MRQFSHQQHHAKEQTESAPFHMQHDSTDAFGVTTVHHEKEEQRHKRSKDGNQCSVNNLKQDE